jgi:hypothetical protein
MVSIKEFPRGINSDQVISFESGTPPNERALDPGLKRQASSFKRQAFEPTWSSIKQQASKPQAQGSSVKPQAASSEILEPRYKKTEEVFLGKGPRAFTMTFMERNLMRTKSDFVTFSNL